MADQEPQIVGEFHYAQIDGSSYSIRRCSDDEIVDGWAPSWYDLWTGDAEDLAALRREVETSLERADENARHFIEIGRESGMQELLAYVRETVSEALGANLPTAVKERLRRERGGE